MDDGIPPPPLSKKRRNQHERVPHGTVLKPWWTSPPAIGGGAIVVVVAIIVIAMLLGRPASDTATGTTGATPLPPAVIDSVTNPKPSLFETVGRGGQLGYLAKLPGSATITGSDGTPLVVYVGAEFCPFCASERWSLAMALARFGRFANLHESSSSGNDVFPNTSTLTFHGSSFSSQWLSFQPVEMENSDRQPLESPSAQVSHIFTTFDQPPYTATAQGFPFLDIGGRFVLSQAGFSPQVLQGKTWEAIGAALSNPSDPITQAVVGNANYITAAICIATGNAPAAICDTGTIRPIAQGLEAEAPIVAR